MKPVIAIRAFGPPSEAAAQDGLVQGFRRELIACLVRVGAWFVHEATPGACGTGSEADYEIEATVLGAAAAPRLVLTLRDMRTSRYLWSERVDIAHAGWPGAHQVLVRRLAAALDVQLPADSSAQSAPAPADDAHPSLSPRQERVPLPGRDSRRSRPAAAGSASTTGGRWRSGRRKTIPGACTG